MLEKYFPKENDKLIVVYTAQYPSGICGRTGVLNGFKGVFILPDKKEWISMNSVQKVRVVK